MRALLHRLRYLLRQSRHDAELAEELEFHRAMRQRDLEREGLPPSEAAAEAHRAFGSSALALDRSRDVWVPRWLQGAGHDVRVAIRSLWSTRVVTLVAILSLGLGIGATIALFSLVDSLVLHALPVRNPRALATLVEPAPVRSFPLRIRYAVWEDIQQRRDLFAGAAAWASARVNVAIREDRQPGDVLWVSGSFFDVLGVSPTLGGALPDIDDPGTAELAAVISYGLWQRRFGGAADAIGHSVSVDGTPFTVVGITPREFFGPEVGRTFDIILPLAQEARVHARERLTDPESLASPLRLMIRLKPDQDPASATAALRAVQPQIRQATLPRAWPARAWDDYLKGPFTLAPLSSVLWTARYRYEQPLLAILAVVVLLLAVACGSVANLLLARATARRHELSVRYALGASRWRLVRPLLAESALLAGAGAALGLIVASWGSRALIRQISTQANPVFLDVSINARAMAFAIAVTSVTALLFGLAPALRASKARPLDALKHDSRATAAHSRGFAAAGLVVGQVALSLVLVVHAGLFGRTFAALVARDLGFESSRVLMVGIDTRLTTIDPSERPAVYDRIRERLQSIPGVAGAAISAQGPIAVDDRPMLGQPIEAISDAGRVPAERRVSALNLVSPGWFRALGVPLLAGRDFTERDRMGSPAVAVVNRAFASRFIAGADPMGRTVKLLLPGPPMPPPQIVGVVADAVYGSLRAPEPPTLYLPIAQLGGLAVPFLASSSLVIRSADSSPLMLVKPVAAAIDAVNPDLAVTFQTLDEQIGAALRQERAIAALSAFFALLALLLAALGLYGVAAYAVARRRSEIGIRMALGATPARMVRLALGRIVTLVLIGVAVGSAASAGVSTLVASLLYGLAPRDPATLAAAAAVLVAVAAAAAWVPARRAAHVDPATALRAE